MYLFSDDTRVYVHTHTDTHTHTHTRTHDAANWQQTAAADQNADRRVKVLLVLRSRLNESRA